MNNNSYFAQYWGIFYVDIRKEEALTSSVNFGNTQGIFYKQNILKASFCSF